MHVLHLKYQTSCKIVKISCVLHLQVPLGPFEISVALNASILGGVTATILLSVPRLCPTNASSALTAALGSGNTSSGAIASGGLVASKLFDPFAPHSHTMSVVLDVQPSTVLDVAISIPGSSSGNELVVLPGSNTTVSSQVEVCR